MRSLIFVLALAAYLLSGCWLFHLAYWGLTGEPCGPLRAMPWRRICRELAGQPR